jgi:hypothetical protein
MDLPVGILLTELSRIPLAPRTDKKYFVIPKALMARSNELRIRVYASSGIATGYIEGSVRPQAPSIVEPVHQVTRFVDTPWKIVFRFIKRLLESRKSFDAIWPELTLQTRTRPSSQATAARLPSELTMENRFRFLSDFCESRNRSFHGVPVNDPQSRLGPSIVVVTFTFSASAIPDRSR